MGFTVSGPRFVPRWLVIAPNGAPSTEYTGEDAYIRAAADCRALNFAWRALRMLGEFQVRDGGSHDTAPEADAPRVEWTHRERGE